MAAQQLDFIFKPYWGAIEYSIGTHIKDTAELSEKYRKNSSLITHAKLIGVHAMMNELDENSKRLMELYLKRNSEMARKGVSGTDLRQEAMDAYIRFCAIMEQTITLMPTDALTSLFNEIDALRIKFHALLSKPKAADMDADESTAEK